MKYNKALRGGSMKIKVHGCRGSIPVSGESYATFGGNTTCIRLFSDHLPERSALVMDGRSGLVPASAELAREGVGRVYLLMSHYHWDHTIGLTLSPLVFMKNVRLVMGGPVQNGVGTREMCETIFRQPFFPVDYREVGSHIEHMRFDVPSAQVLVLHRYGGHSLLDRDGFERIVEAGDPVPFPSGRFALDECLVVRMHRTNHPEVTITYRIDERPSGESFALLTDHENQDVIPSSLKAHLENVDTLLVDCQYSREQYDAYSSGFGHATPDYAVRLAHATGAKRVLLTHHDPGAADEAVERIAREAVSHSKKRGARLDIRPAADGSTYDVADEYERTARDSAF
jgi:phosphoribosyl 1,2-cyclic phosphodiesterase